MRIGRRVFFALFILFCSFAGQAQTSSDKDTVVAVGEDTVAASPDTEAVAPPTGMDAGDTVVTEAPYVRRWLSDSSVSKLKRDGDYAYANDPDYWKKEPMEAPKKEDIAPLSGWEKFRWDIVLYVLMAAIVIFAVVRIVRDNDIRLFYRSRKKDSLGAGKVVEEEIGKLSLEHFLQTSIKAGDYRQAVRYLYLITLRGLNDRGFIRMQPKLTNHDYLYQMKGKDAEQPFRFLTSAYEKVWYGEFMLGREQFERLHHYFDDFNKKIG